VPYKFTKNPSKLNPRKKKPPENLPPWGKTKFADLVLPHEGLVKRGEILG